MPDEYTVTVKDFLYRRFPIIEEPRYAVFWKLKDGKKVLSSAAFKTKQDENGLSVNIAALTTPLQTAGDTAQYGVAAISAATPITLGYPCKHDKQPGNDAHALIVGNEAV